MEEIQGIDDKRNAESSSEELLICSPPSRSDREYFTPELAQHSEDSNFSKLDDSNKKRQNLEDRERNKERNFYSSTPSKPLALKKMTKYSNVIKEGSFKLPGFLRVQSDSDKSIDSIELFPIPSYLEKAAAQSEKQNNHNYCLEQSECDKSNNFEIIKSIIQEGKKEISTKNDLVNALENFISEFQNTSHTRGELNTKEMKNSNFKKVHEERKNCNIKFTYLINQEAKEVAKVTINQIESFEPHLELKDIHSISSGALGECSSDSTNSVGSIINPTLPIKRQITDSSSTSSSAPSCVSLVKSLATKGSPDKLFDFTNFKLTQHCVCSCFCSTLFNEKIFTTTELLHDWNTPERSNEIFVKDDSNKIDNILKSTEEGTINLYVFAQKNLLEGRLLPGYIERCSLNQWIIKPKLFVTFLNKQTIEIERSRILPINYLDGIDRISVQISEMEYKTLSVLSINLFSYSNVVEEILFKASTTEGCYQIKFDKISIPKQSFEKLKLNIASSLDWRMKTTNKRKSANYSNNVDEPKIKKVKLQKKRLKCRQKSVKNKSKVFSRKNSHKRNGSLVKEDSNNSNEIINKNNNSKEELSSESLEMDRPGPSGILQTNSFKEELVNLSEDSDLNILSDTCLKDVGGGFLDYEEIQSYTSTVKSFENENPDIKEILGPIPVCKLFEGFNFVITHGGQDPDRKLKQSFSDDSSQEKNVTDDESLQDAPFDKLRLKTQIIKGGGVFYDFVVDIPDDELFKSVLISDCNYRTANYILAFLKGIPLYHHSAIIKACLENKPFKYFMKHNYKSSVGNISRFMIKQSEFPKKMKEFLKNWSCIVATKRTNKNMNCWKQIMKCLGATLIPWHEIDESSSEIDLFERLGCKGVFANSNKIVIVDFFNCFNLIQYAKENNIPIVNAEWIVQTAINGFPEEINNFIYSD